MVLQAWDNCNNIFQDLPTIAHAAQDCIKIGGGAFDALYPRILSLLNIKWTSRWFPAGRLKPVS
jgi:hypothetical protein